MHESPPMFQSADTCQIVLDVVNRQADVAQIGQHPQAIGGGESEERPFILHNVVRDIETIMGDQTKFPPVFYLARPTARAL
jgi:hypothetical protein